MRKPWSPAVLGVAAAVVLAACGGPQTSEPRGAPAPRENLNLEGARPFVLAEIIRFYGEEADPFIARITSEPGEVEGHPALRLEATVAFTTAGRRAADDWIFWVGFRDGEPGVLRSEGPLPSAPRTDQARSGRRLPLRRWRYR